MPQLQITNSLAEYVLHNTRWPMTAVFSKVFGLLLLALSASLIHAQPPQVALPHVFSPGQPASSAQVNENFEKLRVLMAQARGGAEPAQIDCSQNPLALKEKWAEGFTRFELLAGICEADIDFSLNEFSVRGPESGTKPILDTKGTVLNVQTEFLSLANVQVNGAVRVAFGGGGITNSIIDCSSMPEQTVAALNVAAATLLLTNTAVSGCGGLSMVFNSGAYVSGSQITSASGPAISVNLGSQFVSDATQSEYTSLNLSTNTVDVAAGAAVWMPNDIVNGPVRVTQNSSVLLNLNLDSSAGQSPYDISLGFGSRFFGGPVPAGFNVVCRDNLTLAPLSDGMTCIPGPDYFSSVTDIDGNTYPSAQMCDGSVWTTNYLNTSRFANGDVIPEVQAAADWAVAPAAATPMWSYYENQDRGIGKIYSWEAVNDARGLAPSGWHIATEDDWNSLISCNGGADVAGGRLNWQVMIPGMRQM